MIPSIRPQEPRPLKQLALGLGAGAVLAWGALSLSLPADSVFRPPAPPPAVQSGSRTQVGAASQASAGSGYGGACRSTANGRLELNPTFSGSDLIQVDYWTPGQPERSVLLPGGAWSRPTGMGGTYWVWVGCTFEQAREQVALSIQRRLADGANHAGWGDPGLFTRVS